MDGSIDVTVAAVVERDDRFLLVEEIVADRAVLNQPAGHVEPGEPVIDAVVRETLEETGYRFRPTALIGVYTWSRSAEHKSFLRLCFTGAAEPPDGPVELDTGIIAPRWLSRDELLARPDDIRSPLVLAAIDDYLAGARYPLDFFRHIGVDDGEPALRASA